VCDSVDMESDSNKWFRDKWNRFDKLKFIEDNWFNEFNKVMEDKFLDKINSIDKRVNGINYGRKNRKSK
jgi:hypothetical protein|tara:strand:+ start:301 stop:507 length:207 start_codon:yes stop_codon:yes gene_type:complete